MNAPNNPSGALTRFIVGSHRSIRQAMTSINENNKEVVLVKDDDDKIIGIITDGDVRRGLLRGLTLDSPAEEIMNRKFLWVPESTDRATILDMMKAILIRQIPVLDADMHLLGMHFLDEIIGAAKRPNPVVIMAGGKGTRLRPITESCPKPMVSVAGRPILERIILHLVGYGIRNIFISINYLGHMIEEYFGDGTAYGCRIQYLREDQELGTGGALGLLPEGQTHPIIVMNGDQITRVNIDDLLNHHQAQGAEATMVIGHYEHQVPFGVVSCESGQITKLEEKPTISLLTNQGMYVLNPGTLALVPRQQFFPVTELFDQLLDEKRPVSAYVSEDDWIDIGRPNDLRRANGLV